MATHVPSEAVPKPLRILVVENHPDTLRWLGLYLEDQGHEVALARDMNEAIARMGQLDIEVLLSDIGLPDGTGWELLERAGSRRPPYAVAMSGFGMNAANSRSLAVGFRHHLIKPFQLDELDKVLQDASTALKATP